MPNIIKTERPRKHLSIKKKLIILGIAVLLIGGGIYYYFGILVPSQKSHIADIPQTNQNTQPTKQLTDDQVTSIIDNADQLSESGDNAAAASKLNDAIDQFNNPQQQFSLLSDLSGVYYDSKDYDKALEAIKKAQSTDPDSVNSTTYSQLASIYIAMGDTENAIKSYKGAIAELDSSDDWARNRINFYQGIIDDLGGGK